MTRTRIKICGITREQDLAAAVAAGADALGFVFYASSPRHVSPERAAQLLAQVPAFVTRVGLFVNASPQDVREALAQAPLDLLQFHGDEDAAYCAQFGKSWIKAARVRPGLDLLEYASAFAKAPGVSGLLLDAHVEGYGGGGKTFDWSLIPRALPLPVILSGGLHPDNIAEAVRTVRPWAVDVSSGVEAARGIKDVQKITEFIAGVREADARPSL
ncbi:MAG: phosphoribosylanthranilate isomerase [Rhodocyclales bacterium]|nr:phosphoribosylanthranilate isomerase [Sulfuritalea sp.]MCX7161538.1 phosphoribosylanthranilate isomerase [Rhodocyclales bacterium]